MFLLPFLPPPYPDELLYSICARYHLLAASPSRKQTLFDLFGRPGASAIYDLPNRLRELSLRLPRNTLNTPERLLRRHTMFPLYEPFLPTARAKRIAERMLGSSDGGGIHTSVGVMASSVPALQNLRYCSACMQEDLACYGEPYWHRSHQVSGILVCHKHALPLTDSDVRVVSQVNKHCFVAADIRMLADVGEEHILQVGLHQELADMAHGLLNNRYPAHGLKKLWHYYVEELRKRGFASVAGKISQCRLVEEFAGFYGNDFLHRVGCPLYSSQQDNWLSVLVRVPRKASHPLRHLLLMKFLGLTPDLFFLGNITSYRPFGSAPWPCLNPAAAHYRKKVVRVCNMGRNSENGATTGTFVCECGFAYSRTGPDISEQERYKIGRMVSFGPVWEDALLRFVDIDNKSMRATARLLNVDTKTVIRHLARLRNRSIATEAPPLPSIECTLQRSVWQQLHINNPTLSRTELRKLAPAIYARLYRYDRSWLAAEEPLPQPRKWSEPHRVDWDARDCKLADQLEKVVEALSVDGGGQMKFSVSMFGKRMGALALLQQHLDKLPRTRGVLESCCRVSAEEPQ